ncbi:MAG: V-type ATP synthase subunit D [Clostridia bacterium]|nr:V-type ATP synthase subunit D [Clostridia bacterium]
MAEIRVNPTRIELKKLKAKLTTARRGHKLLKDKRDELMRQFLEIVKDARGLRTALCDRFADVGQGLTEAAAESDERMLTEALMLPAAAGELTVKTRNIMSVPVPRFHYKAVSRTTGPAYGFAFTSGEMDKAVDAVSAAAAELIRLAELEKTAALLCAEIERTRRRVNALEYIMIPQHEQAIKSISMKLDENERGSQTRLMKVKDMMVAAQRQAKQTDEEEA